MPLNIEVKGDPGSIRGAGGWLRSMSGSVDDTGTQVTGARTQSEGGWTGPAAEGFRGLMSRLFTKVDQIAGDLSGTAGALNTHADDLDTVKSRMAQARQIASKGGLQTTETSIAEPGPAPAEPKALPTDRKPTAGEKQAHDAAVGAQQDYAAKVKAYQDAGKVVNEARKKETDSQNHLLNFLKDQAEKSPFTVADLGTGIAGYAAARTSKYRAAAARYTSKAERALRIMNNPRHAGRGPSSANWRRAAILEAENRVAANEAARKATASRLARAVDRLPGWAKRGLNLKVGDVAPNALRNAPRLLRGVPVVGAAITVAGIGYDISQGKDATTAVASGVSSFAAGAAVGAMVGGPVGLVAGAVVGAGVGYVVDNWGDDIANAAGDAAGAVGDAAKSVGSAIGGLFD
ncbi:MAG: hypothetical protein GEV03_19275 [Streptosporangiales bacterium]|nr:hypothetical protein [Streptosporangiales bacterium]